MENNRIRYGEKNEGNSIFPSDKNNTEHYLVCDLISSPLQ